VFVLSTFLYFVNAQSNLSKERQLALKKAELNIKELYNELNAAQYDLSFTAFRYAYIGYQTLKKQHRLNEKELFSIIDFTKDSNSKRFYTIDLQKMKIVFYTYVAHGKKSGERVPNSFSDVIESNKSSIGFYITGSTYNGSNGYSLMLHGDEKGYNSNLAKRSVVIHAADYANEDYIARNGRMGRSLGCPALPENINTEVINTIKEKTMIFAYYNDPKYLKTSKYLNALKLIEEAESESVF
jgi:hypothetical protein